MVKIREVTDDEHFWYDYWLVGIIHYGPVGYVPGLYPEGTETEGLHGHILMEPIVYWYTPLIRDATRFFDLNIWRDGVETDESNEQAAWDFYYEMLGDPYRIISRCGYCFYKHRYLPI